MRRDWITYGIIALALGALLVWVTPDEGADTRSARDTGADAAAGDDATAVGAEGDQGTDWSDWLGGLLALAGLGLAVVGIFKDEA